MRNAVFSIICLILARCTNAQISLHKKPINERLLPAVFIAMDTNFYNGLRRHQAIGDMLISKQDSLISKQNIRIGILEAQKKNYLLSLEVQSKMLASYKNELSTRQKENAKLERKNKLRQRLIQIGLPIVFGTGFYIGNKF